MSTKKMRYYYLKPELNMVFIYHNEQIFQANTDMQFLGSTDNPFPKMAVAAFMKDKPGHRIVDYTK